MIADAAVWAPDPVRGPWLVERVEAPVAALHQSSAELVGAPLAGRRARLLRPADAAVVLGSAQPDRDVDARAAGAAGLDVVRRRSGGGAVLVAPPDLCWVDLLVPRGDALWHDDVGRAAWWVGEAWAAALDAMGAGPASVWRAGLVRTRWSSRVCFAGLGPGEVRVGARKVVGVSQRRTRHGALFQTMALLRWDPETLLDVLALDPEVRAEAVADLAGVAAGVAPAGGLGPAALASALLRALPG